MELVIITHTLIFEMADREYPYHICFTDDGEKYVEELNCKQRGFFADGKIKKCKVILAYEGDHVDQIKRIGLISFVKILRSETPVIALGINIVS